jgi:hypothetical protein
MVAELLYSIIVVPTTAADAPSSGHTRAADQVLQKKKKKIIYIFKMYEIVCISLG